MRRFDYAKENVWGQENIAIWRAGSELNQFADLGPYSTIQYLFSGEIMVQSEKISCVTPYVESFQCILNYFLSSCISKFQDPHVQR